MPGTARRILVVDDTPGVRRALEIMLNNAGYYVTQAANGAEAVRFWRDLGGDLVILDLFMPDKDGMETIVELRALTPDIRIIAMSGGFGDGTRLDLLEDAKLLGAVLAVKKPFTPAEMLAAVDLALNGS
jgi:CheY-like chemotaxis protein